MHVRWCLASRWAIIWCQADSRTEGWGEGLGVDRSLTEQSRGCLASLHYAWGLVRNCARRFGRIHGCGQRQSLSWMRAAPLTLPSIRYLDSACKCTHTIRSLACLFNAILVEIYLWCFAHIASIEKNLQLHMHGMTDKNFSSKSCDS